MATSNFRQFRDTATGPAPGTDSLLGHGCLCGLCTRWCLLHGMTSKHDASLRSAMRMLCINAHGGRPKMQGRAAPAYIFTCYPRAT
jgi:hypothetical protein